MRGSVERRPERGPDVWRVRIYLGRDPGGTKRYLNRTVRGSKADADALCARLLLEHGQTNLDGWDATMADLLERWLALAARDLSPTTTRDYRSVLDRHLLPRLAQMPVRVVRAADLDRLYVELGDAGLGPARIRRIHQVLRNALAQAVRWEWIATNPALSASPPSARLPEITPPDMTAAKKLLETAAVTDPELLLFLHLALAAGARRGELVGLRWADVDLEEATLLIRRAVVDAGEGRIVVKDTKTHQARRIALTGQLVTELRAQRRRATERALAVGVRLDGDGYVFSTDPASRSPWRPDLASHRFARLRARAGLDRVRLHDLRHAMATQLLAGGVDVRTVSGRLGHRRTSTTLDRYAHFVPAADRAAADVMGRLLGG